MNDNDSWARNHKWRDALLCTAIWDLIIVIGCLSLYWFYSRSWIYPVTAVIIATAGIVCALTSLYLYRVEIRARRR